jgi:hypothetical protein
MGVYSMIDPDDKILQRIKGFKSVVIFGCEGCANDSIAYDKGYPLAEIITDEKTGKEKYLPVAMIKETNRLKELFESKSISTKIELLFAICDISPEKMNQIDDLIKNCSNVEAVISLTCPGGIISLKKILPKSIKLIPAMKTLGIFHTYRILDESGHFIKMDMEKSSYVSLLKKIDIIE